MSPNSEPFKVTAESVDPQFNEPYIEVDEWHEEPVKHRYVHGGFKGTDARFSFYYPVKESYQGRFYHNTYPLALTSDIAPFPIAFEVATGNLEFTIHSGAYYVQTNLGGADRAPPADPAIAAYRVNAEAAKYSRIIAEEMYGGHRPFGYLYGGSGGSYQVIGAAENTTGVWDGFVPYVMGTPNSIPSIFTVRMHALRVLRKRNKFPEIMDAINPGGSGNPYAGLNEEEVAALKEATLLGYPMRGWWNHESLNSGYFGFSAGAVPALDPTYVDEFWSKPGYLGADSSSSVCLERRQIQTEIAEVIPGLHVQIKLASAPNEDFSDCHIIPLSGGAKGKSIAVAQVNGDILTLPLGTDRELLSALVPGTPVQLDNSWGLAMQTYQRHQLPTSDLYGWNQYRDTAGEPLYPQRQLLTGPILAAATSGSIPNGKINGKVLVVQALMDIDAFPWQADWYRKQVREKLGDKFDDNFALWYIDHAQHDNPPAGIAEAYTVSYEGVLQQALRDLSAWVETQVHPAESVYEVVDSQIQLPVNGKKRGGIQPVVELRVNGSECAQVAVGETVEFVSEIEVPTGAGQLIQVEWCFEGDGNFILDDSFYSAVPEDNQTDIKASYTFSKPGTYFCVVRATSHRNGNAESQFGRIQNIARVRVIVK